MLSPIQELFAALPLMVNPAKSEPPGAAGGPHTKSAHFHFEDTDQHVYLRVKISKCPAITSTFGWFEALSFVFN